MLVTFTRYRKRLGFATCGFIAPALLSGVITTHAADISAGVNAYHRGDYATALRIMRELADQGDAFAQRSLGVMYSKGQGVTQDNAAAVRWYRKAADQDFAKAQYQSRGHVQQG